MGTQSTEVLSLAAPPSFAEMPPDVISRMLGYLPVAEVLGLRLLERSFHDLLASSVEFRGFKLKAQNLNDGGLRRTLDIFKSFLSLQLVGTKEIGPSGLSIIAAQGLEGSLANLRSLRLCDCPLIDGESVNMMLQRLTCLSHLEISGCDNVSDVALSAIAQHIPRLETLNVAHCPKLTHAGLAEVTCHCTALKDLDIRALNLTDDGLPAIFAKPLPLIRLNISLCTKLTDLVPAVRNCPKLQDLSVKGTNADNRLLRALPESCPDLLRLDLFCCSNISNEGLETAAHRLTKLTHLNIVLDSAIGDSAIRSIAQHCTGLQYLNAAGCTSLTNATVEALAQNCHSLTELNLSNCSAITTRGAAARHFSREMLGETLFCLLNAATA